MELSELILHVKRRLGMVSTSSQALVLKVCWYSLWGVCVNHGIVESTSPSLRLDHQPFPAVRTPPPQR